jgi:hypothetical protein
MLWNDHLDGTVWIDLRDRDVLSASDQRQGQSNECNRHSKNCIGAHLSSQGRCKTNVVQHCTKLFALFERCMGLAVEEKRSAGPEFSLTEESRI